MKRKHWLQSLLSRNDGRGRRPFTHRRKRHRRQRLAASFEILDTRILLVSDFGDAPLPYPTTSVEDGARHAVSGLTLGAAVDSETDGTHSAAADADGADEDGVTFGTIQVGALDATVTVNVQGSAGKLDAWIDFNGDGSWGGAGEQIFNNFNVNTGDNVLQFDVPSWALAGDTFARFRLSTAGDLGVGGAAGDGEVEDYQVTINSPATSGGTFGSENTISSAADAADGVFAADVDGDGDMDVLSASFNDDKIAWYENDGSQSFTATPSVPPPMEPTTYLQRTWMAMGTWM